MPDCCEPIEHFCPVSGTEIFPVLSPERPAWWLLVNGKGKLSDFADLKRDDASEREKHHQTSSSEPAKPLHEDLVMGEEEEHHPRV